MRRHGWLRWILAAALVATPALGDHHLPGEGGDDLGSTGGNQNESTVAPEESSGDDEGVVVDGPEDGAPEDSSGEPEETSEDPSEDDGAEETPTETEDPPAEEPPAEESSPPAEEPPPPEPARPVFDASSWAAVTGPLNALYQAWKAEQAAAGILWDDEGHITNIEGASITSSYRADSVPQEAVDWMVAHADDLPGILVAGSSAGAASMGIEESLRVAQGQGTGDGALPPGDPQDEDDDPSGEGDTLGTGEEPVEPDAAGEESGGASGDDEEGQGAEGTEDVPDLSDEPGDPAADPGSEAATRPEDEPGDTETGDTGSAGDGDTGGNQIPEGTQVPEGTQLPEGTELPEGMEIPEGLELDPETAGELLSGS